MKNINDILKGLANEILRACAFFNRGYHYARIMENKNLVVSESGPSGEARHVGISDIEGNYFYIRVGSQIETRRASGLSDCGAAVAEIYPCALIAIVNNADPFVLKDAILNVLLKSGINVTSQSIDAPFIIATELKGLGAEFTNRATARLKNQTLVKIDFQARREFETNNCEFNPCKNC